MAFQVNRERLRHRLDTLAQIGRADDGGIYRMAFNEHDLAARAWFERETVDAGLTFRSDPAGNLSACLDADGGGPAILTGSHMDSVPGSGYLDGALGVVVALECVQCLSELPEPMKTSIEAIAFSDEEGRFGGLLGSQALTGNLSPADIQSARDLDGLTLQAAMQRAGYDPGLILSAERSPDQIKGFLELHIEQGPVLDRMKLPIGVVSAITGLFKWQVTLTGENNHAGTTPMSYRKDAFQGLVDFASQLQRVLDEYGSENSRATIGKVQLLPGAANVVPGKAVFSFEVRDTDPDTLAMLAQAYRRCLSAVARNRGLYADFEVLSELAPVRCATHLVEQVKRATQALGYPFHVMPSGAAHDAQIMASVTPSAMIFVPSKGGKSHSIDEWTSMDDIEKGANVALNTLYQMAQS